MKRPPLYAMGNGCYVDPSQISWVYVRGNDDTGGPSTVAVKCGDDELLFRYLDRIMAVAAAGQLSAAVDASRAGQPAPATSPAPKMRPAALRRSPDPEGTPRADYWAVGRSGTGPSIRLSPTSTIEFDHPITKDDALDVVVHHNEVVARYEEYKERLAKRLDADPAREWSFLLAELDRRLPDTEDDEDDDD